MTSYLVAPLFQGVIDAPGKEARMLISGHNATGTRRLQGREYLKLLEEHKSQYPQLVQSIIRTHAAAIIAAKCEQQGASARVVYTEGCEHVVGNERMSGGDLLLRTWDSIPNAVTCRSPEPEVADITFGLLQQIRDFLSRREYESQSIIAIANPVLQPRAKQMFLEEDPRALAQVITPFDAIRCCTLPRVYHRFEQDLCCAGSPSHIEEQHDERMERWVHRPLHFLSRTVEHWLGRGRNPEIWFAKTVRQRQQVANNHRYQTGTPT